MLRTLASWLRGAGPTKLGLSSVGGYEQQIINAVDTGVASGIRDTAFAALEHAAGLVGRSLTVATVQGTDLLKPDTLRDIGRDLILRGESVYLFGLGPTLRQSLTRVAWTQVFGDHNPESWRYDLTLTGPTTSTTKRYRYGEVMHPRYATSPLMPWSGISPLRQAALTGKLASTLEASLGREASVPVKRVAPVPTGTPNAYVEYVRESFRDLVGIFALPETTKQAFGAGQSSAPQRNDYDFKRVGPEPTQAEVMLYGVVYAAVLNTCGVPSALSGMQGSTGGALLREAIRIFQSHTMDPLCRIIESEASRVLETKVTLRLPASPEATRIRAQAIKVLKESGIPIAEARTIAGL